MKYRIGIIGSGSISKSHTYGFDQFNELYPEYEVEKAVMCSRNVTIERAMELGWNEIETDWRKVVTRPDIDVIDIVTYDHLHYDIAKMALENGKRVICEKPLADTSEQALELSKLSSEKNIPAAVCMNYRYIHAVRCIKHLVENGTLGEIRHIYGSFLMNWAVNSNSSSSMNWRLQDYYSRGGALGDLGTHIIDMCHYFGMEFSAIAGMNEVYRIDGKTTSNELSVFSARFSNHALGIFEFSRVSGGGTGMVIEIHGTKGNVKWEKHHLNTLKIHIPEHPEYHQGYTEISVTDILPMDYRFSHEFIQMDSYTLLFKDFFVNYNKFPTFEDGYKACKIVDAVLESEEFLLPFLERARRLCLVELKEYSEK
ncbi:MAG: Gfo/Idh/MocA family oxidoreductase [Lachnospiraceae bacterium]